MDILPPSPPLQTHILALHIDQSTGHNKTNGTSAAGCHKAAPKHPPKGAGRPRAMAAAGNHPRHHSATSMPPRDHVRVSWKWSAVADSHIKHQPVIKVNHQHYFLLEHNFFFQKYIGNIQDFYL